MSFNYPPLGYFPDQFEEGMPYNVWCEVFGKYRWYHEDGRPRLFYPLDYNWKAIYDGVCEAADLYFQPRFIQDVDLFTNEFLASVPNNWLKYKTELELLVGTLDGSTLDPNIFEQGYTRTHSITTDNKVDTSGSSENTQNIGERSDETQTNGNNKTRQINYVQGAQEQGEGTQTLNNIGLLGIDTASSLVDNVNFTENEVLDFTGSQTNTSDTETESHSTGKQTMTENDRLTRINYYDNLAFLKERFDRLRKIKPFHNYFDYLFFNVETFTPYWK